MEKTVRKISALKWLALPLGGIMYLGCFPAFGEIAATIIGVCFGIGFWVLIARERGRLIGQTIAEEIKQAISETAAVESFVEIKRLRNGIIARVYLVGAKEQVNLIGQAINRRLQDCSFKKYIWALQLTDMPAKNMLKEMQSKLNEQLLEELLKKNRGEK